MSEIVELVGVAADVAWKLLCALGVLALAMLILDRRRQARAARQVERAERPRGRRAA